MNNVISVISFVTRHLLIVSMAIITGCILWTIAYVVLLIVAATLNEGLGGPIAYPAGIITIIVAGISIGWGVFAPACAIGSVFGRIFGLPRIAAIPVVFGSAFVLSYLLYWAFIKEMTTHPMPSMWVVLKNHTVFLSMPLGAYWWVTEGPGTLFDLFRRWIRRRRHKDSESGGADQSLTAPGSKQEGRRNPKTPAEARLWERVAGLKRSR
ncbi:MAG: hypothetical protein WCI46_05035 [Verrucomicrobiota bacterium]